MTTEAPSTAPVPTVDAATPRWVDRVLERAGLSGGTALDAAPILLVDDEPTNLLVLTQTLRPLGISLLAANGGVQCLRVAKRRRPALILLDVMMPNIDGFEVCRMLKADPELEDIPVVFCSALDDARVKVEGLALGAVDFITKPFDPAEIVARVTTHLAIHRLVRGLAQRNAELTRELAFAREARQDSLRRAQEVLVGSSGPVRELRAQISSLGHTDEPVLILAEAGCGDEAVARAIHEASPRRDRPLLHLECPSLRADDVAAIFGAGASGVSRLESARGGTVFFQGIHRMPPELRQPLFALVDELDGAALDGRRHPLDVRVICGATLSATTPGPGDTYEAWRRHARARRILRLPTLAERRDDIPTLVAFFAERHARLVGRTFESVSDDTLRALARHWWPGNLRELEEVVRSGVLRSRRSMLEIDTSALADGIPFGSYRLLTKLSEGGMGALWEARHKLLARPAVVKLIRGQTTIDRADLERRFELEAKATASLRSPHTVTLFDYGVSEDGEFYYVMEKLDGTDLEHAISSFGPMPAARVTRLLTQACRSLAEAHRAGLVHRDIKPANLFLCRLGLEVDVLKVLDFGVVKWAAVEDTQATPAGTLCGTPAFMSPEAVAAAADVDGQSDIYALGCVAYWMLTARLPFEAPSPVGLMSLHLTQSPPPPSSRSKAPIPAALEAIVMRCLAKERAERPTALALLGALEATRLADGWTGADAHAWWERHVPEATRVR